MTSPQILTDASRQWASRPDDERFPSLPDLHQFLTDQRQNSRAIVVANRDITVKPLGDSHNALEITGPSGNGYAPSHWAFGQLASLAGAPAGYLRKLPTELVADCLNYGLHVTRDVESTGLLLYKNGGQPMLKAATGPDYGRIWSNDIVGGLMDSTALTSRFTIPGEFGKQVPITKSNTTLYAGDRDMFLFLADEQNRIEVPNSRGQDAFGGGGIPDGLARGFFMWNSEVGSSTFGCKAFLFRYACCNRIVWGVDDVQTITIRHTKGAPHRFAEQIAPLMHEMANSSAKGITETIAAAQAAKLTSKLDAFLAERFGKSAVTPIKEVHVREEGRPIETVWDVVQGATAYARSFPHQNDRVAIETIAGQLLEKVAA